MVLINHTEINIANNTKLRANVQYVFTFIYTIRPKSIIKIYNLKQKEFKVKKR